MPSLVQLVAHPVVAEQVKPRQSVTIPFTQVPMPLQVDAAVKLPPPQLAARQTVLLPNLSHAPAPLQWPVLPQLSAVPAGQRLPGSSWPDATAAHVPSGIDPVRLLRQALHRSAQGLSQHMSSTQLPDMQSPPTEQ